MKKHAVFASVLLLASASAIAQENCRQRYDRQTGNVYDGCEQARLALIADPTCDPQECANERFAGTTCYMGEECGDQYIVRFTN